MSEPRQLTVTRFGIRVAYPVAGDSEALILFADFDARSAFDRYTLVGGNRNLPLVSLKIPKCDTELNPIMRRELAK